MLDDDRECRAVVLAAQGKRFWWGADFSSSGPADSTGDLYRAAVRLFPHPQADRGGRPRSGHRRRARGGDGRRLPRRCPRSEVHRELRPSRIPPGVRPQRHPACGDRWPAGRRVALHGSAHRRGDSGRDRPGRPGRCARRPALVGTRLGRRDRRIHAAGRRVDQKRHCEATSPIASPRPPITNSPSRNGSDAPRTSGREPEPWQNVVHRTSRGSSDDADRRRHRSG